MNDLCTNLSLEDLTLFLNILPALANIFGTTSDLIITFLAFNRFILLRSKYIFTKTFQNTVS